MRFIIFFFLEIRQQFIPALIISTGFQQAFDTISWKFIKNHLGY